MLYVGWCKVCKTYVGHETDKTPKCNECRHIAGLEEKLRASHPEVWEETDLGDNCTFREG